MKVYTLGHGALSIEKFLQILRENRINLVVDIREIPFSRYHPHFNRNKLEEVLKEKNIEYMYAGDYLGGSAEFHKDLLEYIKNKGDKEKINSENKLLKLISEEERKSIFSRATEFSNDEKRKIKITEKYLKRYITDSRREKAISFLRENIFTEKNKDKNICFLCSEKDYRYCHRYYLLAEDWLKEFPQVEVIHIKYNDSPGQQELF